MWGDTQCLSVWAWIVTLSIIFQFQSFTCIFHNFILLYSFKIPCVYVSPFPYVCLSWWSFRLTWFPSCCVCVLESKHGSSYLPGQDFAYWAGSDFSVPLLTSINSVPSPKETKALLGETSAWFDYIHFAVLRVPHSGHCFYWYYEQNIFLEGYCWCKDKARFFGGYVYVLESYWVLNF